MNHVKHVHLEGLDMCGVLQRRGAAENKQLHDSNTVLNIRIAIQYMVRLQRVNSRNLTADWKSNPDTEMALAFSSQLVGR